LEGPKEQVTAFHLHAAGAGGEGPHCIDFFNDRHFSRVEGKSSGCIPATADKVRAVIGNPAAYYLNVHSTAFPKGALCGQLR
jgi:CHRD domain